MFSHCSLKMVDIGAFTLPTMTVGILWWNKFEIRKYFNRALIIFIIFYLMVHHALLLIYILLKVFSNRCNTDSSCSTYKFIRNQLGYIEDWKLKHTITSKSLIIPTSIFMCVINHSVPVITTLKNIFHALFSPRIWKKEKSMGFKKSNLKG